MPRERIKAVRAGIIVSMRAYFTQYYAPRKDITMLRRFLLIFSVLTLLLTAFSFALPTAEESGLYDGFIRLHVIANSDGEADQTVKLKVRDAVLEVMKESILSCSNIGEASSAVNERLAVVEETAEGVLAENGFNYGASVSFGREYYPTREYEGVSLPAGVYMSVRVKLGEAEGHNWWCVMFPPLCLDSSTATEKLAAAGFTQNQIRILTDGENVTYKLKFRFLEIAASWAEAMGNGIKSLFD